VVAAPDGNQHGFSVPKADWEMLLEGLDSIAVTLKRDVEILAFRERDRAQRPWIYLPTNVQEQL
jgi:3-isopropylmalate dehydratase small subunit